jgi:ribonuclease T2
MKNASARIAFLLLLLIAGAAGYSKHRNSSQAKQGQPGAFDYYLLTLSWSPEFCYGHPETPECHSHHGFAVHGLWPQYADGDYPENCSTAPGLSNPAEMADIMSNAGLVGHEWSAHGTCSGLDAESYFKLMRQAFSSVRIPSRFAAPHETFSISPQDVKSDLCKPTRTSAQRR